MEIDSEEKESREERQERMNERNRNTRHCDFPVYTKKEETLQELQYRLKDRYGV